MYICIYRLFRSLSLILSLNTYVQGYSDISLPSQYISLQPLYMIQITQTLRTRDLCELMVFSSDTLRVFVTPAVFLLTATVTY